MKKVLFLLIGGLALVGCEQGGSGFSPANPGFEEGKKGWTDDKGASQVVAEAAHSGEKGLRIEDGDEVNYVRVISEAIPVVPGQRYQLRFVARQVSGHGVNAILWFLDDEDELIAVVDEKRLLAGPPEDDNRDWQEFTITGVAPENAVSAQVYVQSNRIAIGVVDFDDFEFTTVD